MRSMTEPTPRAGRIYKFSSGERRPQTRNEEPGPEIFMMWLQIALCRDPQAHVSVSNSHPGP